MIARIGKKVFGFALICSAAAGLLSGCTGNTSGGDDDSSSGTFVATANTVGTIDLQVCEERPSVGEPCGFFVEVKNAKGEPVAGMPVACDSEKGVAIIEPSTGREITDEGGAISGKIGCEVPGSLQFMCRTAVGAFLRKSATIKCQGPIPQGFTGFPNAGGGGLAQGGGVNDGSLAIQSITFADGGQTNTRDIDIIWNYNDGATKGGCDGVVSTRTDDEAFTETYITITSTNNSNSTVSFPYFSFVVVGGGSSGGDYTSPNIALQGDAMDVAPGASAIFTSVLAYQSTSGAYNKYFVGSDPAEMSSGTFNVKIIAHGLTANAEEVDLTGYVVLSFANFNRC